MSSLLEQASIIITPNGVKAGKLYGLKGTDLDVVRATTATRVNSAGLIETVANNVARLDYTDGSCPSILVEPQRTNSALYSEQFNDSYWTSFETSISANATASPNGATTADKIIDTTVNTIHANFKGFFITAESTLSYFVKSAEYSRVAIGNFTDGGEVVFNLATGTVVSTSSNWKNSIISALSNGWYKISATTNVVLVGAKAVGIQLVNNSGSLSFAGTGTSGLFIWGAQLEAGSYPTSYIPTVATASTRNADVISKTGIADLIGQSEGTLFCDIDFNNIDQTSGVDTIITLNNGSTDNEISILLDTPSGANKTFLGYIRNAASNEAIIYAASPTTATRHKVALSYKLNDVVLYINGIQIGTDTSAEIPSTSNLSLNSRSDNSFFNIQKKKVNSALLFKTRLTNAQLATLTTL